MPLKIGESRISRVYEQHITPPLSVIVADTDFIDRNIRPLPHAFFDPETRSFELTFQSWLIEIDGALIVVDPCNGNGRIRPSLPFMDNLEVPWLERFAATGHSPDAVDIVFCTHLHCDHCGWNAQSVNGKWQPTFPNATYHFVSRELDRWKPDQGAGRQDPEYNADVFAESIKPILDAGLAKLIDPPHTIAPGVSIVPAPGHTPGHSVLRLSSAGETAWFTGDLLHHPAQIFDTRLAIGGCDDPALAAATRKNVLGRIADEHGVIIPAHFGAPHHGNIARDGDSFRFIPGESWTD